MQTPEHLAPDTPCFYRKGYLYQLAADLVYQLPLRPSQNLEHEFFSLSTEGLLTVREKYAWDGATDFPDMLSILGPSAAHDAGYQGLRTGLFPPEYRVVFDQMLKEKCIAKGMNPELAEAVYLGVHLFAENAAKVGTDRKILTAP